jgi:Tol biopolymer transport system component
LLELPEFPTDMNCTAWNPDGARILCAVGQPSEGMWSLGAFDGGDPVRITANPDGEQDNPIGYSPDGRQIAFMRTRLDDEVALTIVDADGNNLRPLTDFGVLHAHESQSADWAPDGSGLISLTPSGQLVFVHADGSGIDPIELDLGTEEYFAFSPSYSPDGSRIAFAAQFAGAASDIYTADVDGSNVVQVTDTDDTQERFIDWTAAAAGQATAPSVPAPGVAEAAPVTVAAPAASSEPPPVASSEPVVYAGTSFVIPFEATIPTSVQPEPTAEETNFVTWESADGDRAIRFLAPVHRHDDQPSQRRTRLSARSTARRGLLRAATRHLRPTRHRRSRRPMAGAVDA